MWGAIFDTSWIQKGDAPVGCVQSLYDYTIPWNSGKYFRSDMFMLYGSNSIYTRALNQGITTILHRYISDQHDLGIKVSPYRDSTIQLMSGFFYQLINNNSNQNSPGQKEQNAVLQRAYLVKTEAKGEKRFSLFMSKVKNNTQLLVNVQNVQVSDTTGDDQRFKSSLTKSTLLHF